MKKIIGFMILTLRIPICSFTSITIVISVIFFMNTSSLAQEDGDPVSIGTYRKLNSKILNEDRTLLVNLPRRYNEPTIRYSVLYIL